MMGAFPEQQAWDEGVEEFGPTFWEYFAFISNLWPNLAKLHHGCSPLSGITKMGKKNPRP
jgi:hypothetical protein